MSATPPVIVKSSILGNDATFLLQEVAFSEFLRLQGRESTVQTEPRPVIEEHDVTTGLGIRLNSGEFEHHLYVDDRFKLEHFERNFLRPLLGDILDQRFHPLRGEIRSLHAGLVTMVREFDNQQGDSPKPASSPLLKASKALVNFIDEIIDLRLKGAKGEIVSRYFENEGNE